MTFTIEKKRDSSYELLKIIAIVLIVLCHTVQGLFNSYGLSPAPSYLLPIGNVTNNVTYFILAALYYCGDIGNTIFLLCSINFLVESKCAKKKKLVQLVLDVWCISVIIFLITFFFSDIDFSDRTFVLKQFLPTTFANNWFVTCYIILYAIHPALNVVINKLDRPQLSQMLIILSILYIGASMYHEWLFVTTQVPQP